MNKKLAVILVLVMGLMPSYVFSFNNPLKSYNLYDDVMGGGGSQNSERETVMGEYYSNSLRKPGGASAQSQQSSMSSEDQLDAILEILDIMTKAQETMNNESLSMNTKLNKLKQYNNELRTIAKKFPNDPDITTAIEIFDANDELFSKLNDSSLTDDQKMQAIMKHSNRLSSLTQKLGGSSTGKSFSSLSKADLESYAYSMSGRNSYLRESSYKTYSNSDTPQWLEGPSFYDDPSLESIKEKYRKSNFAGCMQEAESYVRQHPYDTLGFYYLAMSYAKTGNKENAIKAYERVISLRDNPMIVKYATNGRNCVMGKEDEARCYQDVNIPELKYPYQDMAETMDMTPVDVDILIETNVSNVQRRLTPIKTNNNNEKDKDGKSKQPKVKLPFGEQDSKLDEFINAPYGNGLSPELNQEYQKQQLKQLQQNINREQNGSGNSLENIKNFDNKKTEAEEFNSVKLAYDNSFDFEQLKNDPEYIRNKKEMDELNILFGGGRNSSKKDLMDMIPSLTDKENGISPEMFSQMMMNSIMPDIIETDTI